MAAAAVIATSLNNSRTTTLHLAEKEINRRNEASVSSTDDPDSSSMKRLTSLHYFKADSASGYQKPKNVKEFLIQATSYLFSTRTVVYPQHPFKLAWDKLLLIFIVYITIEIPLHVSFHIKFIVAIDFVVTVANMIDVLICSRTTFRDKATQKYELNLKHIRAKYFKTWFFIDLISSVPIAEIASISGVDKKIEEVLSLLHLFRMLRIGRILHNVNFTHGTSLMSLAALFLGFSHLGACAFHYFGALHIDSGWLIEDDLRYKNNFTRYVAAFYWALGTITTVVYGDIHALSFDERLFSCVMVGISAIVYSLLLAFMSLILSEMFQSEQEVAIHKSKSNKYSKEMKLDLSISKSIMANNDYHAGNQYSSSASYFLNNQSMPISIKYRILNQVIKPVVQRNIVFSIFDSDLLLMFAQHLHYCVCTPGEYVIATNQTTDHVYIIQAGQIRIVDNDLSTAKKLVNPFVEHEKNGDEDDAHGHGHGHSQQKTSDKTEADDTSSIEDLEEFCILRRSAHFGEIPFFKCQKMLHDNPQLAEALEKHTIFSNKYGNELMIKRTQYYKASKSNIAAQSITSSILYSITYKQFQKIVELNPYIYQIFEKIAFARDSQPVEYNDELLRQTCFGDIQVPQHMKPGIHISRRQSRIQKEKEKENDQAKETEYQPKVNNKTIVFDNQLEVTDFED